MLKTALIDDYQATKIDPILQAFINDNQLNDNTSQASVLVDGIEGGDVAICQHLFAIIEASKQDQSIQRAAGNAIDILNKACISLTGRNFKGAHIDGANLSGSVAKRANFDDAILRNMSLINAKLKGATFDNTYLENVEFIDELYEPVPFQILKEHKDQVHILCALSDGLFASGSRDGEIKIWDSRKNFSCIHTLTNREKVNIRDGYRPINIIWLKNSQLLISKFGSYIEVWSSEDNFKRIKRLPDRTKYNELYDLTNPKRFHGLYELSNGTVVTIAHQTTGHISDISPDAGLLINNIKILTPPHFKCIQEITVSGGHAFAFCELQNGLIAMGLNCSKSRTGLYRTQIVILDPAKEYGTIITLPLDIMLGRIEGLCTTSEGHLLSSQSGGNLMVWDPNQDFKCIRVISGLANSHENYSIFELYKISENLIAYCGSNSIDFRSASTEFAVSAQTLDGQTGTIFTLCKLTNDFLLGGFADGTIKVWKPKKKMYWTEINLPVTSKAQPLSTDIKRFTRTCNVEVLLSYFKNLVACDTLPVSSEDNDLSMKELQNLFDQLLDELVYLFNDSTMEAILAGQDNGLPIPYQYAKAAAESIRGNTDSFSQLIAQGKDLDKPILLFFNESIFTTLDPEKIAVCLILPTQYTLSPPYFREELVIQHDRVKVMLWCTQQLCEEHSLRLSPVYTYVNDGTDRNFKLVYDTVMAICGESFKDKVALDKVKALCDSFYEYKINSFLRRCNEAMGISSKLRRDKKYIPLVEYLAGFAGIKSDPKIILKGYQLLYPHYQEVITTIVQDICKVVDDRGLFPNNIIMTLDNFKAFLQIAFYRDNQLEEVLKQAHQQKWLNKPFPKLNLMNLVVSIALSFEEGDDWGRLMQSIKELKDDHYEVYKSVIDFLGTKVQKGMMSKGLTSRSWYNQIAQKLSVFSCLSDTIGPETFLPPLTPTSTISPIASKQSVIARLAAFPVKDLENILSLIQELNLEEILTKTAQQEKTSLFSSLNYWVNVDTSSPMMKILAANLTFGSIFSIVSTSNLSLSNVRGLVSAAWRGEDMSQPNEALFGKKMSGIMASAKALTDYFMGFYVSKDGTSTLDHEALVLQLLQDKALHKLLTNVNVIQQIAGLCSAVRIPGLNQEEVQKAIAILTGLQELIFHLPEKEKISATSTTKPAATNSSNSFLVDGITFVLQHTKGDGACALHASLGIKQGNQFLWQEDGAKARIQFAHDLTENLKRKEVKDQLTAVIKAIIKDRANGEFVSYFTKLRDAKAESKQLIDDYVTRAETQDAKINQLQKNRQAALVALLREILTNDDHYNNKAQLLTLLKLPINTAQSAEKICGENIDTITQYFIKHPLKIELWNQWNHILEELAALEEEQSKELDILCSKEAFCKAYLQIILDQYYWFTSGDMELIALVYEMNIQEFHRPLNKIELSNSYNPGAKKKRIIFLAREQSGKGSHYWRCEEEVLQNATTTSSSSDEYRSIPKISSYSDLLNRLLCYNAQGLVNLTHDIFPFIQKLEQVIHIYLQPQIFSIQLLASPIIEKLLKENAPQSPLEKNECIAAPANIESFHDCKKIFDQYGNKRLGEFVSDPMDTYIHNKTLEMYYFTHKKEKSHAAAANVLCVATIKGFSFKEFSFKRSQFHNFDFTKTYFEGCDFSDVTFSGIITLSNTFMDAVTAKTFLPALRRSLVIGGDFKIKGQKGIILISLKDKKKNERQSIPEELSDYVDTKHIDWETTETYRPTFEKSIPQKSKVTLVPPSQSSNTMHPSQDSQQSSSTGWFDYIAGGLEAFVGGTTGGLQGYYNVEKEEHAEDVIESNKEEISKSAKLEEKLKKLKKHVQQSLAYQEATNIHLDNEQKKQSLAIEEQEALVDTLNAYLGQLKSERREKQRISKEQKLLLNRKDQTSAFYQTFLTELCSSLQVILILQNNLNLINPVQGQITTISNKQEKYGQLIGAVTEDPTKLTKAYQWLMAGKDHIIGVANMIKPALSLLSTEALSVDIISPILDIAQKGSDQKKLGKAKSAYCGLTTKTLEKMADAIARKITFAYEEQIQLLSFNGAMRFAECGVLRIIAALFNGYLEASDEFANQAWLAIRSLKTDHNASVLGIEIPYSNKKLQSKKNKDVYFTEDDLYRLSGIAYKDEEGTRLCFSNDRKKKSFISDAVVTKANQVGYMCVSKAEWEKYFQQFVTIDSDQMPSQSSSKAQSLVNTNEVKSREEPLPIGKFLILDQEKINDQLLEFKKRLDEGEKERNDLRKQNEELKKKLSELDQKASNS